jgi:hypothetical protein
MEQRAREAELGFRYVPKGTMPYLSPHDQNINGGIRLPGGPHA